MDEVEDQKQEEGYSSEEIAEYALVTAASVAGVVGLVALTPILAGFGGAGVVAGSAAAGF